jgi:hypothetical protein
VFRDKIGLDTYLVLLLIKRKKNNMTQIFSTILLSIFIVVLIGCAIMLTVLFLAPKSLLCAKIYTFIFEHDDWKLYKKIKKQGIQHYLNVHHLKQFTNKWKELKAEYGIINDDFSNIDENTSNIIMSKFDKLSEECHYKEYHNVTESIKSDDVVLVGELFGNKLTIQIGYDPTISHGALYNQPMIREILNGHDEYVFKIILKQPQQVISF